MRTVKPLMGLLGIAVGMMAVPLVANAETVKVGIILSYSGQAAASTAQMDKGIRLYMKEHEKELGDTKIELIRRDATGPNPDVAKRLAQELITRDRVNILTGFYFTPNINAVAPLATEAKVPTIIMNAATSSTLRLSPYLVRVSFTLWQEAYPFGKWVAGQHYKTAYTAVTDYAPGHDTEAAFTKSFTEAGGKMVGQVRMPLKNPDYIPFLQRIKDEKPDAMLIFVPGSKDATAVMKAYTELGFGQTGIHLVATQDIVPDSELPNMGDVPPGVVTVGTYSAVGDRPANKAFVAAWKKEYGPNAIPDVFAVDAYDGMAAIFHVVEAQKGKIDPDRTMDLLKHW
ncbi:MAG: ABC transporter substrate-binding protein, partial [Cyanobacteria bacterium REEB65]|nr:ABC transporter substrate-binding protein [Cyanobacteria bacterium REEB65]